MTLSERLKKFDLYIKEEADNTPESPELVMLCTELTKALSKKIATIPIWFDYSKEEQQELILNFLNSKLNEQFSEIKLTSAEKDRICSKFFDSVYGFGSLDFLIAQQNISKIFVNSPFDIYIEKDGYIEKADVVIDEKQFNSLIHRLVEVSGKSSSVITYRFNNLLVNILQEPVCETKLVLKKVSDTNFDFDFFELNNILNREISTFLKNLLNNKKRILISSPIQCGKTSFLNAFINGTPTESRLMLFEEGALINSKRNALMRFDVEGLVDKEQRDLIRTALYYRPDYIFADINDLGFNIEVSDMLPQETGFISTIRANSVSEAINFYTSIMTSRLKCTEKLAKVRFAKDIDYIIQLQKEDNYFKIASIAEVGANKAGSPVITEILSYSSGFYEYKFDTSINLPNLELKTSETKEKIHATKPLSFSARLTRH